MSGKTHVIRTIDKILEMAKKIVELRTKLTVDAIAKALAPKGPG